MTVISAGKKCVRMKRLLTSLSLFLWLLWLCMGCSSFSSSSSSTSTPTSPGSSSPSSAPESSASAQGGQSGNVIIAGSTAMQPLLTKAVSDFQQDAEFQGTVTLSGGGSHQGLADLLNDAADIAASDISPTQAGLEETGLVDHQVAVLAVAVVVSPDVSASLTNISVSDLKGIYTGAITDWVQVAGWKGASLPISVCYQRAGSGIRTVFETYGILTAPGDEQLSALSTFSVFDSSASLTKVLQTAAGAIGYAALPFCSDVTALQVDGVQPSYDNVYTGKYKIWACQHLYTKGEPTGAVKLFLDFLAGDDFQESLPDLGYGLISEMTVSR